MKNEFSLNRIALSALLAFSLLPGFAQTTSAEVVTLKAPRTIAWSDFLGVNAHFLWFDSAQNQQQMQQLKNLGLQWVRVDIHWNAHETTQGNYQNIAPIDALVGNLNANQLKSLFYVVGSPRYASSAPAGNTTSYDQYPPVNPQYLANFMNYLVNRYPTVNAWQIWNEPNILNYWQPSPNSAQYAQLLQTVKTTLRAAKPALPITTAGMAYYSQMAQGGLMLQDLQGYGALDPSTITAYHPYSQRPEGEDYDPYNFLYAATQLNNYLRGASSTRPIWATEWGWSSYMGTPDQMEEQPFIGTSGQADYVLRRLALMSAMDYDKIFLFALSDLDTRATFRDRSYGLLDMNGQPKPVYNALKNFFTITGASLTPADPPQASQYPNDLFSITWKRSDGKNLWIGWSASSGQVVLPGVKSATLYDPLTGISGTPLTNPQGISVPLAPQLRMLLW